MRTSLNNIKAIDDYLSGRMAPCDVLLFEANMLLNNNLINDIQHQQSTYEIVRRYSRQKLEDEIAGKAVKRATTNLLIITIQNLI